MTQSIRRRVESSREQTMQPSAIQSVEYDTPDGKHLAFTAQDIRKAICPLADDKDLMMFLSLCKAQQLNPFTREVYLIKYSQKAPAQMVVGKDVFYKRAEANPNYRGIKSGVVYIDATGEVKKRKGQAVYGVANETLVGAWAEVYRADRTEPVYVEVSLEEYRGREKSLWDTKPATMLVKVAEVQALRRAFPDMGQLYLAEEMDGEEKNITAAVEEINVDAETGEILDDEPEVVEDVEQMEMFPDPADTLADEAPEQAQPMLTEQQQRDNGELWQLCYEATRFGFSEDQARAAIRERYKKGGIEHARRYVQSLQELNAR